MIIKDILIDKIKKYGNEKNILMNEVALDNLYAFSPQINGLFEWLEYKEQEKVLLACSFNLSMIELLHERKAQIYIYGVENSYIKDKYGLIFVNDISDYTFDKIILCDDDLYNFINLNKAVEYFINNLNEDGYFVLAFNNYYGFKYTAGAKIEKAYSYDDVQDVCSYIYEKHKKNTSIYLPFPDYKIPNILHSAKYLPKEGELSFDVAAYNYPHIAENSLAINIDRAIKKDDYIRFANSYLLIIGNKLDEIYIKYNRNRKEEYQIKTIILDSGRKIVKKSCVDNNTNSKEHLNNFVKNYGKLAKENSHIEYVKPSLNNGEVYFEYYYGKTISEYLHDKYLHNNLNILYNEIKKFIDILIPKDGSFNFDATFDNFLLCDLDESIGLQKAKIIGIDYEWISDSKYEKDFCKYRILDLFYEKYLKKINVDRETYFSNFGISEIKRKEYREKELQIQKNINADIQKIYLDNYFVDFKTYGDIKNNKDTRKIIDSIINDKKLTQQHIDNLECLVDTLQKDVHNLQNDIKNIEKAYEDREITFRQYLRCKVDKILGKDSKKRKLVRYTKLMLLHPKRFYNMISDADTKNRMLGSIFIGDCYLKDGKIEVPKYDCPLVSIVIPVYNQINYTYECVKSIINTVNNIDYEIIIADDNSSDATKNIDKYIGGVKHIRNKTNEGFVRNCNNGSKNAIGKYIVFLNNDTVVKNNWLSSLVRTLVDNDDVGLVGSKLLYPNNTLQEAGGIIWSDGSGWNYGRNDDPNKFEYNYLREVDYISGASIIVKKELFDGIGGFDELYVPAYCEDSDLCFEVRKRGYKVVYQPQSECIHFEGISNGRDVNGTGLKKYQVENTIKLKEKWKNELKNQCDYLGVFSVFKAKDRAKNKKIVIFIDHYVPTFDKDAGSKTTFSYIQLFLSKGYIVKFIGDDYRKEEPYASTLMQMGVEVFYGIDRKKELLDYLKNNQKDIFAIYLNRPDISIKYIDFIKNNTNIKMIYYGHDLHFLREEREYKLTGDEKHKLLSEYYKDVELTIMKNVDVSYYPSDIEIDYLHSIDSSLNIKAINAFVYDKFLHDVNRDFKARKDILFVGGFAHKPNKDAVLWFINEIWNGVRKEKKFNFYIVGSKADDEILSLHNEEKGIIVKGFISDEELHNLYKNIRLVVVPLRFGAGVKGKVIEALYNYVPVLTTSVGAEGIKNTQNCMRVADDKTDYIKELLSMYNDTVLLKNMSIEAENYIRKYHSFDGAWDRIKDDFS